ncbi:hypothetical protein GW17_00023204 [Ensete ventricosum]|nr:hypothetical protein GW17_00023204 [Ensete ventricosum]
MLLCRFRRWLSPFAPRSSVCRPRRLSSIFPSPPVADMGKSVARGGSSEAKPKEKPSPVSSHKDEAYLDAVIQKRVHLFETIQVQQKAERLNLDGESIKYVFCPLSLRRFRVGWQRSLEMEYGCKLCIGPCTTRGEVLT